MAIDRAAVELWRKLKPWLPARPLVLEIGEANWYGDVPLADVPELADVPDWETADLWAKARLFYERILDPARVDAVDLQGTREAWKLDLNEPLPVDVMYDVVVNTGTTEHVFDQRQVFETIHDRTKPGGLMVHAFPVGGCKDHGFYTYSPCLLAELLLANGYWLLAEVRHSSGADDILHLAWQKVGSDPFQVPWQNGYKGVAGGKGIRPHERMRRQNEARSMPLRGREEGQAMNEQHQRLVKELESLERQRVEALATLHRIDGAISMARHLLTAPLPARDDNGETARRVEVGEMDARD